MGSYLAFHKSEASRQQRIGIYVGKGASHSWLWFVDMLERHGFSRISFLDEEDVRRGRNELDIFVVSGGDTFAVAEALGLEGGNRIKAFVEAGGLYIGSCAGAYLPLRSSQEPLCHFNFVQATINNFRKTLPAVRTLPEKFCTPYGCSFIVHPVRDEVRVRISDEVPCDGGREITVPIFGGPPLRPSPDVLPIAHYCGFTERSVFLTDPEIARTVYIGAIAACEKQMGDGYFLLLGPHFEHPGFPEGNAVVVRWIERKSAHRYSCTGSVSTAMDANGGVDGLQRNSQWELFIREMSNARIRAWALERRSLSWRIGAKVYDPEKILVFLEAVWKRRKGITLSTDNTGRTVDGWYDIAEKAQACNHYLRCIAESCNAGDDTTPLAEALFSLLKHMTAAFLTRYFHCLQRHLHGQS